MCLHHIALKNESESRGHWRRLFTPGFFSFFFRPDSSVISAARCALFTDFRWDCWRAHKKHTAAVSDVSFFISLILLFLGGGWKTIWFAVDSVAFNRGLLVHVGLKVDTERSFMTFNNDGGQKQTHHSVPDFSIMKRDLRLQRPGCHGNVSAGSKTWNIFPKVKKELSSLNFLAMPCSEGVSVCRLVKNKMCKEL